MYCRCTKREPPEETYSDVSVFGLQTIYVVVGEVFIVMFFSLIHAISVPSPSLAGISTLLHPLSDI